MPATRRAHPPLAQFERRQALGRSRVGALTATYSLVGVTVVLASILFAGLASLGTDRARPPHVAAVRQGSEGLQIVRADSVERSQLLASLSVPGRVAINAPAAGGPLLIGGGVPIGATGTVDAGDILRVCVLAPAPVAELTLVDRATGATVGQHAFRDVPVCGTGGPPVP